MGTKPCSDRPQRLTISILGSLSQVRRVDLDKVISCPVLSQLLFVVLDLETKGTNFIKGATGDKDVFCNLNDPTAWTANKVELKVSRIKPDPSSTSWVWPYYFCLALLLRLS